MKPYTRKNALTTDGGVDFHTTKHNRDVALTDLLAELGEKYAHVLTPQELERIQELTSGE